MIDEISKVILFVDNQEEAILFWTKKMNFCIVNEQMMGPSMVSIEVKPNKQADTGFIIYQKDWFRHEADFTKRLQPLIALTSSNIEQTFYDMKCNGIEVMNIINMPFGKMFSFKDQDGNDYMIRET